MASITFFNLDIMLSGILDSKSKGGGVVCVQVGGLDRDGKRFRNKLQLKQEGEKVGEGRETERE